MKYSARSEAFDNCGGAPPLIFFIERLTRHFVTLLQDLDIIQIYGFSAFMDDSDKMIAGRQLRGTPQEIEGLLVEAIWLIINHDRHRPEIPPALVAQIDSLPCKAEGYFIPNTC